MSVLTKKQRQSLEKFAEGTIGLEVLIKSLEGVLEINFTGQERQLKWHDGIQSPEVRVKLSHIRNAMDRHARGEITTEELADWAAMLLLNDAFGWEGPDQEEISEQLNDLSFLTIEPQTPMEDE